MENIDAGYKEKYKNQILRNIKFYNTKETYLALEDEKRWVIQGGVEFIFDESMISFGWSSEMQLYELIEGDLDQLIGEMDVYDIELETHEHFQHIINQEIEDIAFNWSWYQKLDDEMELTDEKVYIPQEIVIHFANKQVLQLATILFNLKEMQIVNPVFDPQGNLLIALNNPLEILENVME